MNAIALASLLLVGAKADAATPMLVEVNGQQKLITPWGSNSLRLQAVPSGASFPDFLGALLPRKLAEPARLDVERPMVINGNIQASVDKSGRFVVSRVSDGKQLFTETQVRTIQPRSDDPAHSRYSKSTLYSVQASVQIDGAAERVYGLGQHTTGSLEQTGRTMSFNQENTQVFIPFVVSSNQYGYLMNYPGSGNVKMQTDAAVWSLKAAEQFDVWVTTTASTAESSWAAQVMSNYADATGHSPVLPQWASGLWQSKNRYQTKDELMGVVNEHRSRKLPLSVIVADYFTWSPSYHLGDYKFDTTCWSNASGLISDLESLGVHFMMSPYSQFINNKSENYAAAKAAGDLLAVHGDGKEVSGFQYSAIYNLYTQKTRDFVADIIGKTYLKDGLKVVWHDCDEWCSDSGPASSQPDLYYPSVGAAEAVASAYPAKLAQTWAEAYRKHGVTDGIQLGRSAWAGTQQYGHAVWSGDIGSNWQSLTMSISAGQSIGLSGIPWWTTDVGGYGGSHGRAMNTTDPDARELMVRWVQFGAFCPLFRIHGYRAPTMNEAHTCPVCTGYSCDQGHETAAWAYGQTAYEAISKMIHVRESLRPYIDKQMEDVAKMGVPFMRPIWFEFPDDPVTMTADVENGQFMAGSSYLVAPVTKSGDRSKKVYLPNGARWKHYFTNQEYDGGKWTTVPAPLDTPPVFLRMSGTVNVV